LRAIGESQAVQVLHCEMAPQCLLRRARIGHPIRAGHRARQIDVAEGQRLARRHSAELRPKLVVARLGGGELAGRHVGIGESHEVVRGHDGREVVVGLRPQHVLVDHGARRDHAGNRAIHEPIAGGGHLVADRDPVPGLDQPGDVAGHGVMGHTAHGRASAATELAEGQHDLQLFGGDLGVAVEQLVEVAQPEEQQRLGMLAFYVKILAPQRCQRRRAHAATPQPPPRSRRIRPYKSRTVRRWYYPRRSTLANPRRGGSETRSTRSIRPASSFDRTGFRLPPE